MSNAEPRVVISFPCAPSFLSDVISEFMPEQTDPFTTEDAFKHIALLAKNRLVLMSPFFDSEGAEWALETFNLSSATSKILICSTDKRINEVGPEFRVKLKENGVQLWQFAVPHEPGTRRYALESFHCKIALADKTTAYLGSANLTGYSRGVSLECGVILSGPTARKVAGIVDAVLSLSRSI